jgi:uncharacterized protein YqjF (DUF2071 family)
MVRVKPQRKWWLSMRWHDLLFAHWRVAPEALRDLVPAGLEIDTFDGAAWIGVVPFQMTHIHTRWTPPLPMLSAFAETNLRTYVRYRNRGGVYFISLDAPHLPAVLTARHFFHLPYFVSAVSSRRNAEWIEHRSIRRDRAGPAGELNIRYRPIGEAFVAQAGTLAHFLTERYRLFTSDRNGNVCSAEISHKPWQLQDALAQIDQNTLGEGFVVELTGSPLLHFARRTDAVAWMPHSA